jgi:hypothetical protein
MRRAARVDANHAEIVAAFRACGCQVLDLSRVGGGCPDLLVSSRGGRCLFLVEVKDGAKSPSRRKLTPLEAEFHTLWTVHIVEDAGDVPAVISSQWEGSWIA